MWKHQAGHEQKTRDETAREQNQNRMLELIHKNRQNTMYISQQVIALRVYTFISCISDAHITT